MIQPPLSFDRVARDYERTRPLPPEIGEHVGAYIASLVSETDWILDAGCGTGRFTRPLARHHARTVGADVSGEMLAELKSRQIAETLPLLVTADLRSLPFADAQFAAVLAVHVLHLIRDWQDALAEMWRVLSPGGAILLGYEDRAVSAVRDFYMMEGRRRGLLPNHPGARSTNGVLLPHLEARHHPASVETVSLSNWHWTNRTPVAEMLASLDARLFSSQWAIPESAHAVIMATTRENARATFGTGYETASETQETRFVLHVVRKPN